jgi:hypothetical protein
MDVTVASGATTTLEFTEPSPTGGLTLGVNGRWLPAERTVVVNPDATSTDSLHLVFAGGSELDLTGVYAWAP